jgi:hypothetical protein
MPETITRVVAPEATDPALQDQLKDQQANGENQPLWEQIAEGQPNFEPTVAADPATKTSTEVITMSDEASKDLAHRYTDSEILGNSYRVRMAVQESGTQGIKAWETAKAAVINTLDRPGRFIKRFAANRAEKSLNRKLARQASAKNVRLHEHRQTAVDKAQAKFDRKTENYAVHNSRMEKRTKSVTEHAEERRKGYVDYLIKQKQEALGRKAARKQHRADGASRRETRELMWQMTDEHLDHVGKLAVNSEVSHRKLEAAKHLEAKAIKTQRGNEAKTNYTIDKMNAYQENVEATEARIKAIEKVGLPRANRRVKELKNSLRKAKGETYGLIAEELSEAENRVSRYKEQLGTLPTVLEENKSKKHHEHEDLGDRYLAEWEQTSVVEAAQAKAQSHGKEHISNAGELKEAITVSLNHDDDEKED